MQLPGSKYPKPNNTAGYKPSVEQGFHLARYKAYQYDDDGYHNKKKYLQINAKPTECTYRSF